MYVEIPYFSPPTNDPRMVTMTLLGTNDLIGWVFPDDLNRKLIKVYLPQKIKKFTPLIDPDCTSEFVHDQDKTSMNDGEKADHLNDWLNPSFIKGNISDPYFGEVVINQKNIHSIMVWTYALARFYCHQQLIVSGPDNKDHIVAYMRYVRAREWLLDPWLDWQTIPARDLFAEQEIAQLKPYDSFVFDGSSNPWCNMVLPGWACDRVIKAGYLGKKVTLTKNPPNGSP